MEGGIVKGGQRTLKIYLYVFGKDFIDGVDLFYRLPRLRRRFHIDDWVEEGGGGEEAGGVLEGCTFPYLTTTTHDNSSNDYSTSIRLNIKFSYSIMFFSNTHKIRNLSDERVDDLRTIYPQWLYAALDHHFRLG